MMTIVGSLACAGASVGLLALGFVVLLGVGSVFTRASAALAEPAETFLTRSAQALRPLGFADLSSRLVVDGRAGAGRLHYRGHLRSLGSPDDAYLVFDEQLRFGSGVLELRTTEHRVELAFGGLGATEVEVRADGERVGRLRVAPGEVSWDDREGRTRGRYRRHRLTVAGLRVEPSRHDRAPYYGEVEVDGRVVAELNRNPVIAPDAAQLRFAPLVRAAEPTEADALVLLALIGWEIHRKTLTR